MLELKNPFALVSRAIFAGHTAGAGPRKLFLYVVSRIMGICTILTSVVGIFVQFFLIFIAFGIVFRVGLLEEVTICGLTHPYVTTFQVVRDLLSDGLWRRFADKSIGISTSRHHREICSDHIVGRLNILVWTLMPRETRAI